MRSMEGVRKIARMLTIVENRLAEADSLLQGLSIADVPVIGITGPPGAGKSTLANALIVELLQLNYRIAVLAVDPSSPFNFGSLLGDRIRMQNHATNPDIFIRSVASRGSLGGLSSRIVEMADVLRSVGFDMVIIETVGVGQSEVEIAALADLTLLVLVPESGDEVQFIKAGIMEIADAFIVNKADRPGADLFARKLLAIARKENKPVIKTIASTGTGVQELLALIKDINISGKNRVDLLTRKAWNLIQEGRMLDFDRDQLQQELALLVKEPDFNLYRFVKSKLTSS